MNITLNNRPESIDVNKLTIAQLLLLKNYTFKMTVIKINGQLIKKNDRDMTEVQEGDDVQILHMISGG